MNPMIFALIACIAMEEDSAIPVLEQEYTPTVAKVSWDNDTLKLSIQGPTRDLFDQDTENDLGIGTEYRFGIVESLSATGGSCGEQSVYGCWTGEDCSGNPYIAPSGQSVTNKCHSVATVISSDSTSISIEESFNYSLSVEGYIAQPDLSSTTTAFPSPSTEKYEFRVSYFLEDVETGECWAWGVEPSYFDDQNCDYPSRFQDLSTESSHVLILD
jgi:hypothetical protein